MGTPKSPEGTPQRGCSQPPSTQGTAAGAHKGLCEPAAKAGTPGCGHSPSGKQPGAARPPTAVLRARRAQRFGAGIAFALPGKRKKSSPASGRFVPAPDPVPDAGGLEAAGPRSSQLPGGTTPTSDLCLLPPSHRRLRQRRGEEQERREAPQGRVPHARVSPCLPSGLLGEGASASRPRTTSLPAH